MSRPPPSPRVAIAQALAVTMELCATQFTDAAVRVICAQLADYPVNLVLRALERCGRELQGRLTLAAILQRIEQGDGRPAADAAWALVWPFDEARTIVAPTEAIQAAHEVAHLEDTAARMAFRARYEELVREAREVRRPARWEVTLGTDPAGRGPALARAEEAGRLPPGETQRLLGQPQAESSALAGLLTGRTGMPREVRLRILQLLQKGRYGEAGAFLEGLQAGAEG